MSKEQVLVIIVTYNAMKWLERCIGSLFSSTIVPDVFIVDNGSTDGTKEYIHKHYPYILFRQNKDNLGFGKANNIGLQYALDHQYDYVYLLNQDAWVMPDTLSTLVTVSEKYPEYGVLSPFQMEANMQYLDKNFARNTCNWNSCPELLDSLYFEKLPEVLPVQHTVMAAHWLISNACLRKVGGFSPAFQQYGEDNNYLDRLKFWRFKVGIVPAAKAIHDRENRFISKAKERYMLYTAMKIMLSSPIDIKHNKLLVLVYMAFKDTIKRRNLDGIKNLFIVMGNYPSIKRYRKMSQIQEGAFLEV